MPIPEGFRTVTPYLIVRDAAAALDFYSRAFGAEERYRLAMPDGKLAHSEFIIGDCVIMMADEAPEWDARSPATLNGTPVGLCLYVHDCDAVFARALAAGAVVKRPIANQFYGDRSGTLIDPFRHEWTIATHVEDVEPDEMKRRMTQRP